MGNLGVFRRKFFKGGLGEAFSCFFQNRKSVCCILLLELVPGRTGRNGAQAINDFLPLAVARVMAEGPLFDEELAALAELVERHDLWVVSDELHCDLLLDEDARHRPLAAAFPTLAKRTITLWAPSKTFNLAGLTSACAVIPDPELRHRFATASKGLLPDGNVLGLVAAEAAYRDGEPWRQALLSVLREHRATLQARVTSWPGVRWSAPESTYLAWLDMREAGLGVAPYKTLLKEAGVALSDGAAFGCPGYVRLNFGTTASQLEAALSRMDTVLKRQ